jgi:hypothetical protein
MPPVSSRPRPAYRTPTPDFSSDDEQAARQSTYNPAELDTANLDISHREDHAIFKPTPFNLAKIHGTFKRSSQDKSTGRIQPALVDPDKPPPVVENKQGKTGGGKNGYVREGGWEVRKAEPAKKKAGGGSKAKSKDKKVSITTDISTTFPTARNRSTKAYGGSNQQNIARKVDQEDTRLPPAKRANTKPSGSILDVMHALDSPIRPDSAISIVSDQPNRKPGKATKGKKVGKPKNESKPVFRKIRKSIPLWPRH